MATVPAVYDNNTPIVGASLSPLQLALANYMAVGNPLAFAPNERFLQAMKNYCDSFVLSPLTVEPRTGFPRIPDLDRNIVGIYYLARGDDLYVFRKAPDCGPDENRYELAFLGKRSDIASGSWVYYGPVVGAGRVASASVYQDAGDGGYGDSPGGGSAVGGAPGGSIGIAGDCNNGDGGNGGNGNGDGNGGSTASA